MVLTPLSLSLSRNRTRTTSLRASASFRQRKQSSRRQCWSLPKERMITMPCTISRVSSPNPLAQGSSFSLSPHLITGQQLQIKINWGHTVIAGPVSTTMASRTRLFRVSEHDSVASLRNARARLTAGSLLPLLRSSPDHGLARSPFRPTRSSRSSSRRPTPPRESRSRPTNRTSSTGRPSSRYARPITSPPGFPPARRETSS